MYKLQNCIQPHEGLKLYTCKLSSSSANMGTELNTWLSVTFWNVFTFNLMILIFFVTQNVLLFTNTVDIFLNFLIYTLILVSISLLAKLNLYIDFFLLPIHGKLEFLELSPVSQCSGRTQPLNLDRSYLEPSCYWLAPQ